MTAKKLRALQALLSTQTRREAAEQAGISESTLRRYFSDADFRAEYQECVSEIIADATLLAQRSLRSSLETLRDISEDDTEPSSARIAACRSLLEYGLRLTEIRDLSERLEELEKTQALLSNL